MEEQSIRTVETPLADIVMEGQRIAHLVFADGERLTVDTIIRPSASILGPTSPRCSASSCSLTTAS